MTIDVVDNYGPSLCKYIGMFCSRYERVVVSSVTDAGVVFLDDEQESLPRNLIFYHFMLGRARTAVLKSEMAILAADCGFAALKTTTVDKDRLVSSALKFPMICKANDSLGAKPKEMFVVRSPSELASLISSLPFGEEEYLLQEFVDTNEGWRIGEAFSVCAPDFGRQWIVNTQKDRVYPEVFGSTASSKTHRDDKLAMLIAQLHYKSGYYGIIDVEYFERDGVYHLIEVNFRPGTPIELCYWAGVNIPVIGHRLLLNLSCDYPMTAANNIRYAREPSLIAMWRRGQISLGELIGVVASSSSRLVFAKDDLGPMFVSVGNKIKSVT